MRQEAISLGAVFWHLYEKMHHVSQINLAFCVEFKHLVGIIEGESRL